MTKLRGEDGTELFHCPVQATMSVIGGKYKAVILHYLRTRGTLRFSELQHLVPYATSKVLTQQLRELQMDGILRREVYPVVPPKTEYSLTERGQTLSPLVEAICSWGKTSMRDSILPENR